VKSIVELSGQFNPEAMIEKVDYRALRDGGRVELKIKALTPQMLNVSDPLIIDDRLDHELPLLLYSVPLR
jgi:hypothetical protein